MFAVFFFKNQVYYKYNKYAIVPVFLYIYMKYIWHTAVFYGESWFSARTISISF